MPQISMERKDITIPSYSYFGDSQSSKKNKKASDQKQRQSSLSEFVDT